MPTKSASKTITRDPNWLGPAIPPGEMLLEEILKPMGIGQVEAARRLGISLNRLNEIVLGKRGISADTALRLGSSAEDVAAVLDAASGRLGSSTSHSTSRTQGILMRETVFRRDDHGQCLWMHQVAVATENPGGRFWLVILTKFSVGPRRDPGIRIAIHK